MLPALAMVLYSAMAQRRENVRAVHQGVLTASRLLAQDQEKEFLQAALLFAGVSRLPDVIDGSREACGGVLSAVHGGHPRYINIGVIDASQGSVLCTVVPVPPGMRMSPEGLRAVREATTERRFAVSGFTIGQISRQPLVMLAYPVGEPGDPVARSLYAALSLDWVSRGLAEVELAPGAAVLIADDQGTVLARHPDPEAWVGARLSEDLLAVVAASASDDRPPLRASGLDGLVRFYASTPLHLGDGRVFGHVLVGVPVEQALRPVQADLRRNLIWLALLSLTALTAAWFGADFFVLRRVEALLGASQRMEAGDLSTRTGIPAGPGELERLGGAFDRMASALQAREEALRQSGESYRGLFNSLIDLVYVQDLKARFLEVNDVVVSCHGWPREQVVGRTPEFLIDTTRSSGNALKWSFGRVARGGPPERVEAWGRRQDGSTFPVELVFTRSTYFGQDVVITVGRDLTERRRAEEMLRQRDEELRQAQKMEAVGRLAGGIAHDFNNLLTAIKGNVELALLDLPFTSPVRAELEQAAQAADTAATLTRQLLSFSRKQTVQPQPVELNDLITSTSRLLQRLIGANVELVCDLEPGGWPVLVDPSQVEQVLMNLTVNARDAMPDGGTLCVRTRNLFLAERDVTRPSYVRPGAYVMLTVSDDGSGMDPQVQERVFEPFFTTKEKDKGTGLGLFTVYGIVRQNGGHIWLESSPGKGTSVRILLPRANQAAGEPQLSAAPAPIAGSETILLVEDEASVRLLAQRLLQRIGYRVLVAVDGVEALRVSEEHTEPIDLLLTDMTMPRMGGVEVARRLRAQRPELRVIYMSGYTEETLAGEVGPDGEPPRFVQKPFTLDVLAASIRESLDSAASAS